MWLRSGGEHSDPELAVRVRRGTLALAVEVRGGGGGEGGGGGGGTADIKSNNPHLTGREKHRPYDCDDDPRMTWCLAQPTNQIYPDIMVGDFRILDS